MAKQIWKQFLAWTLFCAVLMNFGNIQAQDKGTEQQIMEQDRRLWLMEKLKIAKPAPTPSGISYSEEDTLSSDQNTRIEKNLNTGIETVLPPSTIYSDPPQSLPFQGAGLPSYAPLPDGSGSNMAKNPLKNKSSLKSQPTPEGLDTEPSEIEPEATPPGLLLNTTGFPYNTAHKLMMEFYSSTDDEYYYYVCSGWSTGSFQIATAGHCVYSHDPNGDGDSSDASWATEIWSWAAQTDRVDPFDVGDYPYGVAKATFLRSYTGWTSSVNFDHDWAMVTLDRRQGDHTGWMGRESGVTTSSLNFTGYPAEYPYVPYDTLGQYPGYDAGNVTGYTSGRIIMDAYIYGGHSGGPSWRYDETDRWVQGIHSTSNRTGYAEDTLLTSGKLTDMSSWISEDETSSPPVARPNLIEYWFDTSAKDIINNNVAPGDDLSIEYNVFNAGFSPASNTRLDFYLSTNDYITTGDIYLGGLVYTSLGEWSYGNSTAAFTVPGTTPEGTYYAGWLLSTDDTEYNTDDNQVVITSEQVTVSGDPCTPDQFEPDDASSQANPIAHNSSQTRNICPAGDEDWVTFTLAEDSGVSIETSGVSSDTRLWLYDSGQTEIEFDDDDGSSFFSLIHRQCGVNHLPPGTYYIKVDEFDGNDEIDAYDLSLTVTECIGLAPDIRVDPLSLTFEEPASIRQITQTNKASIPRISSHTVHFKRGPVDPAVTENLAAKSVSDLTGRRHTLMQFESLPSGEDREQLASQGIHLLSYLPDQTFWVGLEDKVNLTDVKTAGGVRWAWVPDPIYKISQRIDDGKFPPNAKHSDGSVSLQVLLFQDVDDRESVKIINSLGNGVRVVRPLGKNILEVKSPRAMISTIADLDVVRWVEPANPPRAEQNATAAQRVNADLLRGAPYNVDGTPLTVGVWDGGAVDSHTDFGFRLTVVDLVSVHSHSTHVAGTIGGSGAGDMLAMGMAPAIQLRSYDWNSDTTEMRTAATSNSVVISNHSYGFISGWDWDGSAWVDYGDTGFGQYDSYSQEYDDIVFDTDLLVFKSAGNDRNDGPDCPGGPDCDGPYDSIGYIGNAKNIVSIGALTDTDGMSEFSSWGPSDDGRIKPDLCANGVGLWSTLPGNTYGSYSGTSMSSPSAAGTAVLLFEHFRNNTAMDPSAALLKTLMIHGAQDLGIAGPDYQHGWGIIDAQVSADLISVMTFTEDMLVSTGDQTEFSLEVTGGSLKVTLGWTDPAGEPSAAKALVNDLNLVLISPGGTEHHPWILDPLNPEAAATTGTNDKDNIEQVHIDNPETGTWTVRVSGFAVPFGPQRFALVGNGLGFGTGQILTIHNDGTSSLTVTDILPETAAPWISVNPTSVEIPAGESRPARVEVDFDQAPDGSSTVRLLIHSNDPDETPYPDGVDVIVITDTDSCECDLNKDHKCDMQDWLKFGEDWGRTDCNLPGVDCECDLNSDGKCDMQDWLIFGEDWGRTDCP